LTAIAPSETRFLRDMAIQKSGPLKRRPTYQDVTASSKRMRQAAANSVLPPKPVRDGKPKAEPRPEECESSGGKERHLKTPNRPKATRAVIQEDTPAITHSQVTKGRDGRQDENRQEGHSQDDSSLPAPRSLHRGSRVAAQCVSNEELLANIWWTDYLREKKWRLFYPKLVDYGFIPAQFRGISVNELKMAGTDGVHYAIGWESLYKMITTYGQVDGRKIISLSIPPLPDGRGKPTSVEDAEDSDDDIEAASLATQCAMSPHPDSSQGTSCDHETDDGTAVVSPTSRGERIIVCKSEEEEEGQESSPDAKVIRGKKTSKQSSKSVAECDDQPPTSQAVLCQTVITLIRNLPFDSNGLKQVDGALQKLRMERDDSFGYA